MSNQTADAHSATNQDPSTMIDLLRRNASEKGELPAYTFLVDGEAEKVELTYGELDRRSRAIGASLQLAGAIGEPVLLLYPPGLEFIVAFLGCLYAGAIAVPAFPPRLNRSQLRLQQIIEDTQAAVALTTKAGLDRADRVFGEVPSAKNLKWLATDDLANELERKWQGQKVDGETLAMIQYTSGSTSAPKGVMVSHGNLLSSERMIQQAFRQTEDSIVVGWLPLYHDMGLIGNVLQPLFLGARCILMSPAAFLQKPVRWLQAITDYRATTSGGPNFAFDLCVRKIGPDERNRLDLSTWSVAFNGAEPIFHETMERFAATFASCGFRRESFHPCFGLAEATLLVSAGPNHAQPRIKEEAIKHNRPITPPAYQGRRIRVGCGQVLPGERVVIVDPESLTPCPAEKIGEIWVAGPHVARGYWNRDQETEQTFEAYLAETGEGPFLRTGDLGYIENGELFVAGRIKDLVIIRGLNHYPQDIELTVRQSNPVLESGLCAVFSIEEADQERLVIAQELSRHERDPSRLIEGIREAVAREHEIQTHAIVLIDKGSMPKTTSGKVQRYECRNKYESGKLPAIVEWRDDTSPEVEPVSLPSINGLSTIDALAIEAIEASLLSFLAAKLRRGVNQIGLNQPLLSYGIDSLTAIELSHHLESKFGVTVPSVSLLEDLTVARLARKAIDQLKAPPRDSRPPITPVPREGAEHPLSYGQRSLWFLHQLAPLTGAYNVSSAMRIRSVLDTGALRRALRKIVDRHETLRTTFSSQAGEPLQIVHAELEVLLPETDASGWSDEFLDDCLAREAHRPFDLEQGPLLRASLFTRSPEDHILLVVAHHLVADLWSMGVLIHELGICYGVETGSAVKPLNPLPVQYVDYVYWRTALLAGSEEGRLWSYWKRQLAGDLGALDLPTDRPRPRHQTFRGSSQSISLSLDLTQALKSLGQNHGATLYMTLQAVFHVLLHRYTAQEDLLIGSPVAGRSAAELAGLIGYFVDPVVLRADISGNPMFCVFLERVREMSLAAFAHQDYPFALLVERLQPTRDPSRSPLFQVMFGLQKAPSLGEGELASRALIGGEQLIFGGLSAETLVLRRQASQFDLSLFVVETEDGLKGFIEYNADLFDAWRIRRMADHFRVTASAVTANPKWRISEIDLLNERERWQILVEWNGTEKEYSGDLLVHELITEQARLRPEGVAVIYEHESVSYEELDRRGNQLAHYLRSKGIRPETLVGICFERSVEMVIAILGVLKTGAAYVPIDPTDPKQRIDDTLKDAQVALLLTQERLAGQLEAQTQIITCLDKDWDQIGSFSCEDPANVVNSDGLAYVIYTSGSTGRPKGVMNTHRGIRNRLLWMQEKYELNQTDRVLQKTTFSFDVSVWEFLSPLMTGAVLVMARAGGHKDSKYLLEVIKEEEVTTVHFVPSMLEAFLEEQVEEAKSLRRVICSGEALTKELERRLRNRTQAQVSNLYGPTEAAIDVTYWISEEDSGRQVVPIGRPIANIQMYVLNPGLEPAPVGVTGEIYISGIGLARGYLRRSELTAEKFIPSRFGKKRGERLYRTGDLGRYLSDGNIEFVGRVDEQVKVRGYRVELGEIQAVLNEHRSVQQSVVIVNEHERGKQILGYVVGEEGVASAELKQYLKERLPEYMVPEAILALEKMPLTASGKIDRKRLPTVKQAGRQTEQEYAEAQTPVEEMLVGIFLEVLKVDRVGIHDNFYEIGGHSLLAIQVISRVRQTFRVDLDVRSLFEEPTIKGLGRRIGEVVGAGNLAEAPPLVRAAREDRGGLGLPLSFVQQRLWFLDQLEGTSTKYNMSMAHRLHGELDREALEKAVNTIIERHEILRTRFVEISGEPIQVIEPELRIELPIEDLSGLDQLGRRERVTAALRQEGASPFDLIRGPMLRVKLLKLGEQDHLLLRTMHHIIYDIWSETVFGRELAALYQAFRERRENPLPPLTVQYADFALWQRQWLGEEAPGEGPAYWRRQLAGIPERLELPTDKGRPAARTFEAGVCQLRIDARQATKLKQLSQSRQATLYMTLLAAYGVLLGRYSGQDDIVIGSPIANRRDARLEELIGLFVNALAMRLRVKPEMKFGELLEEVKRTALEAYQHQDVPFERLVEEFSPERSLDTTPIFQVVFTTQNAPWGKEWVKGLTAEPVWGDELRVRYDLEVGSWEEEDGELFMYWLYSRDLFERWRIEQMGRHYLRIIEAVISNPERQIADLELLADEERRQILEEWNRTARQLPKATLPELFEEEVRKTPEAVAVVYQGQELTYRELNQRSNHLAWRLIAEGIGPEDVVALAVPRSLEMIIAVLGISKAGAAYLPIDPDYPAERVALLLADAEAALVLGLSRAAANLPYRPRQIMLDRPDLVSRIAGEAPEQHYTNNPGDWDRIKPLRLQNPAYIIYTSGSTVQPASGAAPSARP
jgi:amino acid adenylation domain-containing protein